MWIIDLTPLAPGVYNDHRAEHITAPPDGWAMIPDDFPVPSTYPRLGSIEAEEVTYTREVEVQKEVTKTREIPKYDEDGNMLAVMVTEEYTELETVMEEQEYTMMTVTAMTEGTLPEVKPEEQPVSIDQRVSDLEETAVQQGELLNILLSGETGESV